MSAAAIGGSDAIGRRGFAIASIQTFVGTFASRALLFALAIVTARLLGTSLYGEFAVVQSTVLLLAVGLGQPLAVVCNRYSAAIWDTEPGKAASLAISLLWVSLLVSVVAAVGLFLGSSALAGNLFSRPSLGPFLAASGVAVVLQTFFLVATATLRGCRFFKAAATTQALQALIGVPLALLLVWRWGLWGAVLGLIGLWAVGSGLAAFALGELAHQSGVRPGFKLRIKDLISVRSFYFPYLLSVLGVVFSNWCVRTLLTHGPDAYRQVGLFSAGFQYAQVFQLIVGPLLLVATPILTAAWSRSEHDRFRETAADLFKVCFILLAPLSLTAVGCAPWLVAMLGGDYSLALHPTEILFVALAIDALLTTIGPVLIAAGHPWILAALTFVRITSLIGLTALLLSRGAMGAALAYLVSGVVLAGALVVLFLWLREHEPLRSFGRLMVFSLPGFSLGALGVFMDMPARAAVCGLAAAVLAVGAWRSLSRSDRRSLTKLLRGPWSWSSSGGLGRR